MALSKSNKTPSSRSGYFNELTSSTGRQTNFFLPVRIKVTPNTTLGCLSDGKKNHTKMHQPVLIKDLFQSTKKNKQNTSVISVSTQKKKASQRVRQSYLNTQSCHKSENEEDSSFFNKSYGGNKVRRQLYQNLDSPQKSLCEGQENISKINKLKANGKNSEKPTAKSYQIQSNDRKSLLLPPNSIKNSFMRKSGSNFQSSGKQSTKSNNTNLNRQSERLSLLTKTHKVEKNVKKTSKTTADRVNVVQDCSENIKKIDSVKSCCIMQDNFTMTSPILHTSIHSYNYVSETNCLERPTFIMNTDKTTCCRHLYNSDPLCLEMQNLNINKLPYCFSERNSNVDFEKMQNIDCFSLIQFKTFLEQTVQASENQVLKMKDVLNFVNNLLKDKMPNNSQSDNNEVVNENCDNSRSMTNLNTKDYLNLTNVIDQSSEKNDIIDNVNISKIEEVMQITEENKIETNEKSQISIQIIDTTSDIVVHQEVKEAITDDLNNMERLSTIGEVSCEGDDTNKDEKNEVLDRVYHLSKDEKEVSSKLNVFNADEKDYFENKENENILNKTAPDIPKTPKTPLNKFISNSNCDSQRRRSARLAAKRLSMSLASDLDVDKQDSFTLLEKELNVVLNKIPSKSLPASPIKPPMTPSGAKQWDKRVERPLKEYMALKMNGTFLVTPDVKRFQSQLEPTDTPHSRKSLSRKIFMELCDLYAESPEHQ